MVASNFDWALVATYYEFNVPVDQFFGDDGLTQAFVNAVGMRLGGPDLDPLEVMRKLMNLRKKGQLPRLRRAHNRQTAGDN